MRLHKGNGVLHLRSMEVKEFLKRPNGSRHNIEQDILNGYPTKPVFKRRAGSETIFCLERGIAHKGFGHFGFDSSNSSCHKRIN